MIKEQYKVAGMTCGACKAKVTEALSAIPGIESVDVQLDAGEAELHMTKSIALQELQAALRKVGDYEIHPEQGIAASTDISSEELTQYSFKPLILVLSFILLLTLIHEYVRGEFDWMRSMRHYMGGFFIAFSFFKLLDLKGFAYSYLSYDIITKRWMAWGFIYPFIELLLGISLLISFQLKWTLIATIVVMGLSSIGVIKAVLNKERIKCACLGTGFNLPMSTVTIIEDVGMVIMSVIMLLSMS